MGAFIELNGISSIDKGFGVLSAEAPIFTSKRIDFERLDGSMRAIQSPPSLDSDFKISIRLACRGQNKAFIQETFNENAEWLYGGRYLRLWSNPKYIFEGRLTQAGAVKMLSRTVGEAEFVFTANPPCGQRILLKTGEDWDKIPEVLAKGKRFVEMIGDTFNGIELLTEEVASSGSIEIKGAKTYYPTTLLFKVTGGFDWLKIGNLELNPKTATDTLYIDADRLICYTMTAEGLRKNHKHTGDYPRATVNANAEQSISIEVQNATEGFKVQLLAIERA